MEIIYLDNSATTKPHAEVIHEMVDCMQEYYANPSSAHRLGAEAENKLKLARERVSALINAEAAEILFTSGGSESNNTVLKGLLSPGDHLVTTVIEHPSVRSTAQELEQQGVRVTYLAVGQDGIIDLDALSEAINEQTKLVSIMHVNNEIGAIQPLDSIVRIIKDRSRKAKIHVDAVQSAGKLRLDVKRLELDFMSLSAHKFHGPKGIGALYIRKGLVLKPLIDGGGQERGLRSGTENLPAAAGFGIAVMMAMEEQDAKYQQVGLLKRHFMEALSTLEGVFINSPLDEEHVNHVLSVSFDGVRGEVLLHALEDYGIYVSTGSACSSKKGAAVNYVLPAIGLKKQLVEGTVRFSFSYMNKIEEIDLTVEALKKALLFLRRIKK